VLLKAADAAVTCGINKFLASSGSASIHSSPRDKARSGALLSLRSISASMKTKGFTLLLGDHVMRFLSNLIHPDAVPAR